MKKAISIFLMLVVVLSALCSDVSVFYGKNNENGNVLQSEIETQKHQYNLNNGHFDYNDKYTVFFDELVYKKNYAYVGNVVLKDRKTGKEKVVIEDVINASIGLNDNLLYYNDVKNHCIKSCDYNGDNSKIVFNYEPLNPSMNWRYANFVFCDSKMLVTTSLTDYGDESLYIVDLKSGDEILVDNDFGHLERIDTYTYKDNLYYQKGDKIISVDLKTGKKIKQFALGNSIGSQQDASRNLISLYQNSLYYSVEQYLGESNRKVYICEIDLDSFDESVLSTFLVNFPIQSMVVYNDQIFLSQGTGAGNSFSVVVDGRLVDEHDNVDGLNFQNHKGLLGDYLGFCGNMLVSNCWDGMDGVKYGYPPVYSLVKPITDVQYLLFSELSYKSLGKYKGKKISEFADSLFKDKYYENTTGKIGVSILMKKYVGEWIVDKIFTNEDTGFYAVAFKNSSTEQIVLAFRGTNDFSELGADAQNDLIFGILNKKAPQMEDAISATKDYINDNSIYSISTTGHSLGGGLALEVSQLYDFESQTFNCAQLTDAMYYNMWDAFCGSYTGFDKWKHYDHVNEHDLAVGNYEYGKVKKALKHKNLGNKVTAHSLQNMIKIDEKKQTIELSEEIDRDFLNSESSITESVTHHLMLELASGFSAALIHKTMPKGSLVLGTSLNQSLYGNLDGIAGMNILIPHTDVIYGGDGDDSIIAMTGDDYIVGGNGDDDIYSDGGSDTYVYYKGQGLDTIYDGSGQDKIYLFGFDSKDKITADNKSDERYLLVKCNGETIIKVRNYRDKFMGNSLSRKLDIIVPSDNSDEPNCITVTDWKKKQSCIITVACPVEVDVYDADGNYVATIPDAQMEPMDLDGGTFSTIYNEKTSEYEKRILMFEDSGYRYVINSVGNGKMSVNIRSCDENNYYSYDAKDIDVSLGASFDLVYQNDSPLMKLNNNDDVEFQKSIYTPVTDIQIDNQRILCNQSKNLSYEVNPSDIKYDSIEFGSSDESVLTVNSDGVITGVSNGTATVTIQIDDKIAECEVTVVNYTPIVITVGCVFAAFVCTGILIAVKKRTKKRSINK